MGAADSDSDKSEFGGSLGPGAQRVYGISHWKRGNWRSFCIADASGTIAATSNTLQDEVLGSDPHRYDREFERFSVVPGKLVFMSCIELVSSIAGMETLPPQERPEEELLFGVLDSEI